MRSAAEPDPEVQGVLAGWMGRYSRRAPGIGRLLTGGSGWERFREMALFEAVQVFSVSGEPTARVGAGRSYLALADLYAALDDLFLAVEEGYLESLGPMADPEARARRGFVRLRRGEAREAASEFEGAAPPGAEFMWALGRACVAAAEGRGTEARELLQGAPPPASRRARVLAAVCCHWWNLPWREGAEGVFGEALEAFRRGDPVGAVTALQMLDFGSAGPGAGADLFLYGLLRRAFGELAAVACQGLPSAEVALLAGRAREFLDDFPGAAEAYGRAATAQPAADDAPLLFSPLLDPEEALRVGAARRAACLIRAGRGDEGLRVWRELLAQGNPGALTRATVAFLQVELGAGGPLVAPAEAADAAVAAVVAASQTLTKGAEAALILPLYAARTAEVLRRAARVHGRLGATQKAAEELAQGHRKSRGHRPDFANPPAFFADLARYRAEVGEYATAVAIGFELAQEYPSARLAYESIKRLYASRAGGGVPPR